LSQSNKEKDAKKKPEWKVDPALTMDIKKGADWKPDNRLTMRLKESAESLEKKKTDEKK
jgi:hypothetical protein